MSPPSPAVAAPAVAVVGPGRASPDRVAAAEAVGAALARAGAVVVTGGLGGVMEAACRGAKSAGGSTVGILPGLDRAAANPYVDVAVPTGLGEARNVLVVRASDVLVAVGGEYGTLSEIAFALKVKKPVVGLSTWELRREGRPDTGIHVAASPHDAAQTAVRLATRNAAIGSRSAGNDR